MYGDPQFQANVNSDYRVHACAAEKHKHALSMLISQFHCHGGWLLPARCNSQIALPDRRTATTQISQ